MLTCIAIIYTVMTIITIIVYAVDKINSQNHKSRVPEVVFIVLTALGGSLGTILGMVFFDHKSNMSRKWYFLTSILVSVLCQLAVILFATGIFNV